MTTVRTTTTELIETLLSAAELCGAHDAFLWIMSTVFFDNSTEHVEMCGKSFSSFLCFFFFFCKTKKI